MLFSISIKGIRNLMSKIGKKLLTVTVTAIVTEQYIKVKKQFKLIFRYKMASLNLIRGIMVFVLLLILFGLITWKAFETIEDYEDNFGKDDGTKSAKTACIVVPVVSLIGMIFFAVYCRM